MRVELGVLHAGLGIIQVQLGTTHAALTHAAFGIIQIQLGITHAALTHTTLRIIQIQLVIMHATLDIYACTILVKANGTRQMPSAPEGSRHRFGLM